MDINQEFYIEVIDAMTKANVEFLLVGGMAVGIHGYPRYTGDMDLWLRPSLDNMNKLKESLSKLGYDLNSVDLILSERPFNHPTPIRLFDDGNEFKVDLMTDIFYDKLSFDDCFNKAQIYDVGGVSMKVIHVNHLIEIKENVKRYDNNLKDLNDAEKLKSIHHKKSKDEKNY
ncbi:MAG: hypothetical protein M3421_11990 [Bacteroidota bacterium]|nr:hypothetical protein [Bacteroidota bacterium]